jgi:ATP-dependent HslUV protease ATP-binding subunit HslU
MNKLLENLEQLTPPKIVEQLDKYIIGQHEAKKVVSIALRNRIRRQRVEDIEMQEEILPKNILMIGPTGVGKTEIARRMAKILRAPFVKTEATKFTEVGYVGKDVDSIVRDLLENAINIVRNRMHNEIEEIAIEKANHRILDVLVGKNATEPTREKFKKQLENGELEDNEIDIDLLEKPNQQNNGMMDVPGMPGAQMGILNVGDMLQKALGGGEKTKTKRLSIKEAREALIEEESEKLVDQDQIIKEAIRSTEQEGIVFIDEIDKVVASPERRGADASREGVQRDLLPLIEGTIVNTKYGIVKTDHILFIASGAFHIAKPSDLLPELQGRLPVRVELKNLTISDMQRILKETKNSLIKQYSSLMATEQLELVFTDCGIQKIAEIAAHINDNVENIGARRLHTIMEKLLEDTAFVAGSDMCRENKIKIDMQFVEIHLESVITKMDLQKFIL